MQIYLAVTPAEAREASRFRCSLAHVAYCIGPDSTLLRQNLLLQTRGGLLSVTDRGAPFVASPERLSAAALRECGRRSYGGVLPEVVLAAPRSRAPASSRCSSLTGRAELVAAFMWGLLLR